ncbi:cytochrome c oxidase subunit I [Paraliomyxa miuraensis]|uniref:cytochrome c oxidase subunit I n=1 Tax=Paraliomyxa miuraensis TaxID=376150 RepID=UPI0022550681|nr:cbb3-type cytochrome c oxidase subunit I [Paraliomyxa miuraensis]MCX4239854.1 cbb3-type cytochrome c oxidase subunit I [Paraliomyxa miuraensis]
MADDKSTHDAGHEREPSYLVAQKGLKSWLFTVDHKRLGLMYLATTLLFFFVGGMAAIFFRTELLTPGPGEISGVLTALGMDPTTSATTYNKLFTVHGAVMVFLVIIPSVPGALGNFLLPLMLGAKDVAFPRLNLLSFWVYSLGALFFIYTLFAGGLDTGWTFYTPYSSNFSGTAVISATFGAFILGFSSILTGLNFMVTIHKMRAPGMTWNRMPLFCWSIYATAVIQVLATPVLAITLLLLIMERTLNIGIFDPAMGGDPVLFQHFFWFYSHPAVYIMILPGFGIISELIAVHSRKHIFGYKAIALSSVAIAIISFVVWGHHMFVSGQSELAGIVFSFLTFAVAVPTAIKVFSWVATLYKGSIQFNTPMLYGLMFLFTFTIGGLTGVFLGTLSVDVHLHDTYFVVAHFHYVMMGGTIIAFVGGLHHWWAKMTGRNYDEKQARWASLFIFVGFNMTFFNQFVLGQQGMPRRYYTYVPQFQQQHVLSTVGAYILLAGFLWIAFYLLASLRKSAAPKEPLPDNTWGGASLEWSTQTPPIEHNFHGQPRVDSDPYNFPQIDRTGGMDHH